MVDLDDQLVGQRLVPFGHHLQPRHLGDALEVDQRHLREGGELDFTGFQRRCRRRAVGQDAEDDLVQLRLPLAPIGVVARQAIIFAGLVLGELERAGAHQRAVGRIAGNLRPLVEMLRQHARHHRQRIADQLDRRRRRETEDRRVIVGRLHRVEIGEHDASEILQRFPDLHRREGDISRRERLAVMPGDALAQLERDRQAVFGTLPARRQARRQRAVAFKCGFGERLDHLRGDEEDAIGRDDGRVEIARLRIRRDDQPAAPRCIFGMGEARQRRQERALKDKGGRSPLQQRTARNQKAGHGIPRLLDRRFDAGFERAPTRFDNRPAACLPTAPECNFA